MKQNTEFAHAKANIKQRMNVSGKENKDTHFQKGKLIISESI